MTQTTAQQATQPSPPLGTAGDVMRPPLTTADTNDHAAAAAHLMKHARATALMVAGVQTGQPKGILTEADIAHAVADGKDLNEVRIRELMTIRRGPPRSPSTRPERAYRSSRRVPGQ